MKPLDLEWPVVRGLLIPSLLLSFACAYLWLDLQAQIRSTQDQARLSQQIAEQFRSPRDWRNEAALRKALRAIDHHTAWLEDSERARIWHQGPAPQHDSLQNLLQKGPRGVILRWPLDEKLNLVIQAPTMNSADRKHWQMQYLLVFSLAGTLSLIITVIGHYFIVFRWRRLRNWSRELELGQLENEFSSHGISGEIAQHMNTLARRLWYSRQTLNHLQEDIDVRQRQQIRQLQKQVSHLQGEQESFRNQDQDRSALLSGVNHELRTPLTGIIGFADLLEKTQLNAEQLDYVQTIRKSSSDMVNLITDFLDHQRADAGQLVVHESKLDPTHVVEDAITLLAPLAYQKDLHLVSIVDHDVPESLTGDSARLRQILTNLISNAIKFTSRGHVLVRLQRESEDEQTTHLRIQIEDTGCGLSSEQQAKLFGAFQRFESDERPAISGSGLGLRIVRKLTELLGGSIQVESELNRGSTFSVILPFTRIASPRTSPSWDALRNRNVLLYEPNDISMRGLQHQLMFWGLNIETVASLDGLRQRIQTSKPDADIVVLGLDASQLDETAIEQLCQQTQQQQLAVVALINSVDSAVHERLRKQGIDHVLAKSVPASSLYRSLGECLQREQAKPPLHDIDILLAENNVASQRYLASMLEAAGANVVLANNGQQALQQWQDTNPRFVLLDFNMPSGRGDEITQRIRETDSSGRTVIVGMSAHLSPSEERKWYESGLDSLLLKPFDQTQFLRCIHPWLDTPLQGTDGEQKKGGAKLVDDPELAAMMLEELPQQLHELDHAFVQGNWEDARAAAHQLHGTAAFFHLEPLKSHVFLLETRLNKDDKPGDNDQLRDDIINVTQDVNKILQHLRAEQSLH